MQVLDKYRLELHWVSTSYPAEDLVTLNGTYFSGPVLQDTAPIQQEDRIILDFTQQHLVIIPNYYQATLSWKGVEYKGAKVFLKQAELKGKYVHTIAPLKGTDWVLIDCKGHDVEDYLPKPGKKIAPGIRMQNYKHLLVYRAEICRKEGGVKY